jgi:hypothetical protein
MKENLTTNQVAKLLGVTKRTVNRWVECRKLVPAYTTENDYNMFTEDQINKFKIELEKSEQAATELNKDTEEIVQPQPQENPYTLEALFGASKQKPVIPSIQPVQPVQPVQPASNRTNSTSSFRFKDTKREDTLKRAGTFLNTPDLLRRVNNGFMSEYDIINYLCNQLDDSCVPGYLEDAVKRSDVDWKKVNRNTELCINELCKQCDIRGMETRQALKSGILKENIITECLEVCNWIDDILPGVTGIKSKNNINIVYVLINMCKTIQRQEEALKEAGIAINNVNNNHSISNSSLTPEEELAGYLESSSSPVALSVQRRLQSANDLCKNIKLVKDIQTELRPDSDLSKIIKAIPDTSTSKIIKIDIPSTSDKETEEIPESTETSEESTETSEKSTETSEESTENELGIDASFCNDVENDFIDNELISNMKPQLEPYEPDVANDTFPEIDEDLLFED